MTAVERKEYHLAILAVACYRHKALHYYHKGFRLRFQRALVSARWWMQAATDIRLGR